MHYQVLRSFILPHIAEPPRYLPSCSDKATTDIGHDLLNHVFASSFLFRSLANVHVPVCPAYGLESICSELKYLYHRRFVIAPTSFHDLLLKGKCNVLLRIFIAHPSSETQLTNLDILAASILQWVLKPHHIVAFSSVKQLLHLT